MNDSSLPNLLIQDQHKNTHVVDWFLAEVTEVKENSLEEGYQLLRKLAAVVEGTQSAGGGTPLAASRQRY